MSWLSVCEDGTWRHDAFDTRHEAAHWNEWGHACTRNHTLIPVDVGRCPSCRIRRPLIPFVLTQDVGALNDEDCWGPAGTPVRLCYGCTSSADARQLLRVETPA